MSVSKKVKALLLEREKKQSDLMEVLGMSSKQSLSNKFSNERWSAEDLVKIAEYCGCKLAFILPNGERIIISNADLTDEAGLGGINELRGNYGARYQKDDHFL